MSSDKILTTNIQFRHYSHLTLRDLDPTRYRLSDSDRRSGRRTSPLGRHDTQDGSPEGGTDGLVALRTAVDQDVTDVPTLLRREGPIVNPL